MADYTRVYNLTLKDSLPSGNSAKVIKGTELDVELNAVASAISSKADSNSPTFTGTPFAPTASYGTSTTQIATTAFVQAALQALYPVGSIYINASSTTNPSTLLGFGTWVTVGDGKVLVNQDTTDPTFDVLGETVGSKDAIAVAHTHTFSVTTASDGAHTHSITDTGHTHGITGSISNGYGKGYEYNVGVYSTGNTASATTGISVNSGGAHTHSVSGTTASTGSSGTNANIQPSIVVRMWKRTA